MASDLILQNASTYWVQGSTVDPLSISGLQLWLDADDATTFSFSSSNVVSQWNDKSGNARHASQGTVANQPLRISGSMNGRAIVRFDATNDYLALASTLLANSSISILCAYRPSAALTSSVGVSYLLGGDRFGIWLGNNFGGALNNERIVFASNDASAQAWYGECTIDIPAAAQVLSLTYNRLDTARPAYYSNGTLMTLQGIGDVAGTDWETNGNLCVRNIGNQPAQAVYGQKDIAELLVFNRALSDSERRPLENLLAAKWGAY